MSKDKKPKWPEAITPETSAVQKVADLAAQAAANVKAREAMPAGAVTQGTPKIGSNAS